MIPINRVTTCMLAVVIATASGSAFSEDTVKKAVAKDEVADAIPGRSDRFRPQTIQEKYSYSLGFQFGNRVKSIVDADPEYFEIESFVAAMRTALTGGQSSLSPTQMDSIRRLTVRALRDKRKTLAQLHSDRGREFREQYANKPEVKKLRSGVLYKVIQHGDGQAPGRQDQFTVHFEGRLIDGKVFASTYQSGKAQVFSYDSIISGWQEILPMMKPGAILEVVVPPDLGYGDRGLKSQGIPPNSTLQFKLELTAIN